LLGTAVEEEDFAAMMSGQLGAHALFGPQQLVRLTGIWFDWAARDARVLGCTA
jgi:hypothetical protein